jgi:hypothetical protein
MSANESEFNKIEWFSNEIYSKSKVKWKKIAETRVRQKRFDLVNSIKNLSIHGQFYITRNCPKIGQSACDLLVTPSALSLCFL